MRGLLLSQRFRVESAVGSGGMGTVYRARDEHAGVTVAVKVLRADGGWDAERFRREAQVLAELSHPAIVRYVAHGATEAGESYLVMEWIEGETLSRRLAQVGLDLAGARAVGLRVAGALGALHRRGIVHRDVKPGNVMLVGGRIDGATLLDFGIARRVGAGEHLTATGAILGTPGYMAPEQLRGQRDLDARADVFALGCVLFKCLTGRAPFEGEDPVAVMMKAAVEPAPRVTDLRPAVPAELDALLARMLAKAREERPRDGDEVEAALARIAIPDDVASVRAAPAAPALTSTEQLVTCLVLAGHPAPGEQTEPTLPDAAHDARDDAFRAVARAHGGELVHLGRGVLGISLSGGVELFDLALRAGRAALAVRALHPDLPAAVVAGRSRRTSASDAAPVRDRGLELLALASPWAIRLDASTAALLQDRLDVDASPAGPVLRGELRAAEGARRLLGKATACVGRDREIAALLGLYHEVVGEPVARAVLVAGAAGVGKSRVRYEFLRAVAAEGAAEVWIGRGDPMSAGSPFGMLGQVVRAAAGLGEGAAPEARREHLRARVSQRVAPAEVDRVVSFLGELVGAPPDEVARAARRSAVLMGDQIRLAWEDFLAAECAAHPVVIVLEDLQWGDLATVKCLDAALRALADAPLLVLALARREVHELFPRLWEERRVQEIHLAELTPKASARLVRDALGPAVPEAEVQALLQRAGGNAFYLEELIRAAAEGEGADLPDTVLGMLEARLARVDPEARRVLRAASVFGQVFWRSGVVALLGGVSRAPLYDTRLSSLLEQELVTARPVSRFPGEPEYAFRHALVRDATYATLTEEDLALGHRLAGVWLEGAGETQALSLAEHFERGAGRGVACGAAGEELGALEGILAQAHQQRGENGEAERHGSAALASLAPGSARWFGIAAQVLAARGRLLLRDRLVELGRLVEATAPADGEARGPRVIALAAAFVQYLNLELDAPAGELLGGVTAAAEELGGADAAASAWVHRARGMAAFEHGDLGGLLVGVERAVEAFDRAGDVRNACLQRVNVGYALLELGGNAEAERVLRQALAAAERLGAHNAAAMARNNLGLVLARTGAYVEAIAVERAAAEAFERFGDRRMESASRAYLALIHLGAGDRAAAESEARIAAQIIDTPGLRAHALAVLSRALVAEGRAAEAEASARESMKQLAQVGGRPEGEAEVRLAHVEALAAAGAIEEARALLDEARNRLAVRAARIEDPARRASFLEGVPENARTLSLALP